MAFVPVGQKSGLRVADLYEAPVSGVYIKKTAGKFSPVYWLKSKEDGSEIKIYGCKSLDSKMTDDLIGQLLRIACVKLVDIGKSHPMAIAEVCVWREHGLSTVSPAVDMNDPSIPRPQIFNSPVFSSFDEDEKVPEYALTIPEE